MDHRARPSLRGLSVRLTAACATCRLAPRIAPVTIRHAPAFCRASQHASIRLPSAPPGVVIGCAVQGWRPGRFRAILAIRHPCSKTTPPANGVQALAGSSRCSHWLSEPTLTGDQPALRGPFPMWRVIKSCPCPKAKRRGISSIAELG